MRIVLISDTHGNYPRAIRALGQVTPFDMVIHLGDGCGDLDEISAVFDLPVCGVAGNCDRCPGMARELQLSLEGKSILVTHGDGYNVKAGLGLLTARARELRADIAAYGHTHIPLVSTVDGIILVNPGALSPAESCPSVALITIADGTISAEIVPV